LSGQAGRAYRDRATGVLLATSSTEITRGPVAAFDGDVWLVAWIERNGTAYDLRGVALRQDGTFVDASPRLLAADVSNVAPGLASTGEGTVAVLLNRPATGGATAINSLVVDGR
jgi:hypothetical protein